VSLENATKKERNLNHEQNSNAQHDPSQTSYNGTLEKSDEDNQTLRNQSMTLMLVDDDRDILFTFKSILAAEGFKVEAFTDPNEALSRFTQIFKQLQSYIYNWLVQSHLSEKTRPWRDCGPSPCP